jgi:hypothetical protein
MNQKLYRVCSEEEIIILLTNELLKPFPGRRDFLSLSKNDTIMYNNEFAERSDYCVVYDYDKIINQGGIEIEYTIDFFALNPDLCSHVTKENDIYALIEQQNLTDDELLEEYIQMYSWEKEICIREIKLESGLIKNIIPINGLIKPSEKIMTALHAAVERRNVLAE